MGPDGLRLRLVERRDAEAIRAIYNPEVEHTTHTFDMVPRTLDEQIRWIDAHSGGHPAVVADVEGVVAGFGSLTPYRPRPAYSTSVENSVYVHPEWRGRGIGRALLEELVRIGQAYGFHAMFARIVGGHTASIHLHEASGFEIIGREREVGRKFNRWLDVVVMQRQL
jgi:phosphinothricin acetyltransferase